MVLSYEINFLKTFQEGYAVPSTLEIIRSAHCSLKFIALMRVCYLAQNKTAKIEK